MTRTRLLILLGGPPLLISAAYALSYPTVREGDHAQAAHRTRVEARRSDAAAATHSALDSACATAADDLQALLPADCTVIVRAPWVLAGNMTPAELDHLHRGTVRPLSDAMWRAYFDRRPDRPVTIIAARDEATYRELAQRLDGYQPAAYAGYMQRDERRIVFNAATGAGTLAHELAHTLAQFDFPEMPEWFDEGLASLHEEANFSADGLTLVGVSNWRSRLLVSAWQNNALPPLESVACSLSIRGEGEGINYAVVRGLCLCLQERGLLAHFYRKFRANAADDPAGLATLCELLGCENSSQVDQQFREWVGRQSREAQ